MLSREELEKIKERDQEDYKPGKWKSSGVSDRHYLLAHIDALEARLADIWFCPEGHVLSKRMGGATCRVCQQIDALVGVKLLNGVLDVDTA